MKNTLTSHPQSSTLHSTVKQIQKASYTMVNGILTSWNAALDYDRK